MGKLLLGVDVVAHVAQLLLHDPEDGDDGHGDDRADDRADDSSDADDKDERIF